MTDILIRAVPGAVIDEIDRQANGLGISRTEFLRRRLSREFRPVGGVTTEDLVLLAGLVGEDRTPDLLTPDLAETEFVDPDVMGPEMVDRAPA